MLVVHPDSIMLGVSLLGGLGAVLLGKDLTSNSSLSEGIDLLIVFLLPSLILAETMSMDKGFFIGKFWTNLFYSVICVVVNVIGLALIFYYVGGQGWGVYDSFNTTTLLTLGIMLTFNDDTGYKMILTLVKDRDLYFLTRERFLANFTMALGFLYMFSSTLNPVVLTWDTNTYIIKGILVFVISGTLGVAIGFLTTLLQKNIDSIRSNVIAEIMFVFCIIYLAAFLGAVKSFYLSEDIILAWFGLFTCAYARYNFTLESAERMSFLMQLFSRLCRIAVLAVCGLMIAKCFTFKTTWIDLLIAIPCVLGVTLVSHAIFFSLAATLGSVKCGMREFLLTYFANLCKGPLCYLLIEKYMPLTGYASELANAFMVFCTLFAPPMLYFIDQYYKSSVQNDDTIEELLKKTVEVSVQSNATKGCLGIFFNFMSEAIFSPLLIYNYSERYDKGIFAKLRKIFLRSIKFAEVSMDNTQKSKRRIGEEISRILSASAAEKKAKKESGITDSSLTEPLNFADTSHNDSITNHSTHH